MVTTRTSPKVYARRLAADNWRPVRGLTPTFSTGWWSKKRRLPLGTFTSPDEVPGVKALTTAGIAHFRECTIIAAFWCDANVTAEGKSGEAIARSLIEEMWAEWDRIVTAEDGSTAMFDAGFERFEMGPSSEIVDDRQNPVLYRMQGLIEYDWWHAP